MKSIRRYVVILDFVDDNSSHELYLPFQNAEANDKNGISNQSWLHAHSLQHTADIQPNEATMLLANTPLITARCPKRASIIYINLEFVDGTSLEVGSEQKNVMDPLIVAVEPIKRSQVNFIDSGIVAGQFVLAEYGSVVEIKLYGEHSSTIDDKLKEELKQKCRLSLNGGLQSANVRFILILDKQPREIGQLRQWITSNGSTEVLIVKSSPGGSNWMIQPSTANSGVGFPVPRTAHD